MDPLHALHWDRLGAQGMEHLSLSHALYQLQCKGWGGGDGGGKEVMGWGGGEGWGGGLMFLTVVTVGADMRVL